MADNIFFDKSELKKCGTNVIIGHTVRIRHPDLVEIGDNSIIDDFTLISGKVVIGDYVHIGSSCSLQAGDSSIGLGSFSALASGVRVYAVSSDFIKCSFDSACYPKDMVSGTIKKEVVIGEHNQIGANSVILPGVELPTGFACSSMVKLEKNYKYRPWVLLSQNPLFECKRIFKDRYLAKIKKLKNKN